MSTQLTSVVANIYRSYSYNSFDHNKDEVVRRSSTNYPPSAWGHYFISIYTLDTKLMDAWLEESKTLTEKVRNLLLTNFVSKSIQEKLTLIDTIKRLGISYHFNKEIEQALKQVHNDFDKSYFENVLDDNLHITSLLFRLLREHGYNISCDIFEKYKDGKGKFKESLSTNVEGLLSLYEAAHLRVDGETILDEALIFASTNLQQTTSNLDSYMSEQVLNALNRPLRRCLPRVQACKFISLYQENKFHDKLLLRFAKLDFNILQKQHQEELSILSKWWRKLEVEKKLPFARDRIVECYFWALAMHYEPQYATSRKFVTKVVSITSIIDDIYDNYGIDSELKIFADAVERWDICYIDKLPEYMRTCYQALLDVYDEIEEEMIKEGRSYTSYIAKEAMKNQIRAYYEESKWLKKETMPSFEEYMKVALVTAGFELLAITSLVGMGEIATKEAFEWLLDKPQILNASNFICRIMDDMVSHEFERERNHIPSAVQCYMNQYKVSEEQVHATFNKAVADAWNDINKSFLESEEIPISLLMSMLNLARVMDLLYKNEDCYSKSSETMKQHISSILVNGHLVATSM